MKGFSRLLLLAVFVMIMQNAYSQALSGKELTGDWYGYRWSDSLYFQFSDNNKMVLFSSQGGRLNGTYTLGEINKEASFVIMQTKDGDNLEKMVFLIKKINNSEIRIMSGDFAEDKLPVNAWTDQSGRILVLRRRPDSRN